MHGVDTVQSHDWGHTLKRAASEAGHDVLSSKDLLLTQPAGAGFRPNSLHERTIRKRERMDFRVFVSITGPVAAGISGQGTEHVTCPTTGSGLTVLDDGCIDATR